MRDKIIEALYYQWCEGKTGMRTQRTHISSQLTKSIALHFNASRDDYLYIEEKINSAMNESEEIVFQDAFYLCLELLNGNYFRAALKPRKKSKSHKFSQKVKHIFKR